MILQPSFASSDRKFCRKEILSSAVVASDWSGKERAVRLTKISGYIKRRMDENQSIERMDEA